MSCLASFYLSSSACIVQVTAASFLCVALMTFKYFLLGSQHPYINQLSAFCPPGKPIGIDILLSHFGMTRICCVYYGVMDV